MQIKVICPAGNTRLTDPFAENTSVTDVVRVFQASRVRIRLTISMAL